MLISIRSTMTAPKRMVESAFISGLMPRRAMEYMVMDRVETPEPVVKKLMTKSSSERVKAIMAP